MSNSGLFRVMADKIDHNVGSSFGGAAVIVPPLNGGAPLDILILDSTADPAQFWSTVLTRAQIVLKALEDQKALQQGFGRR